MLYKILALLFLCGPCFSNCASVPDEVKMEYGIDMQKAFNLQSEGLSTHAMFYFEQGCMKAMKAGESAQKIEAVRQLFVWYRTYGYFLGLISKDPEICGQYAGNGNYVCNYWPGKTTLNYGTSPELDGKRRDYLMGVAEVLSGILCIGLAPIQYKAGGFALVVDGGKRMWNSGNSFWVQQDVSMLELSKRIEGFVAADKNIKIS